MAQQTAVEFLVMRYHQWQGVLKDIDIEQAKAMEKQQIIDACNALADYPFTNEDSENYYNETYNK
jgi:hypothetical protein